MSQPDLAGKLSLHECNLLTTGEWRKLAPGRWRASGVHEDEGWLRIGLTDGSGHRRIPTEARDVVDDVGTSVESSCGGRGVIGIDGEECMGPEMAQAIEDRKQTLLLELWLKRCGSWSRGLSSEVQDVGSLVEHDKAVTDGVLDRVMNPTIRKGIRCAVEDAHEDGSLAESQRSVTEFPGEARPWEDGHGASVPGRMRARCLTSRTRRPRAQALLWFVFGWVIPGMLAVPVRAAQIRPVRAVEENCEGAHGPLWRALDAVQHEAPVARAHWGVAVSDMSGRCLLQEGAHQFFHPASTAKLLTTAAVMSRSGPDARVTTRLEARGVIGPPDGAQDTGTGKPGGRVLRGDLVLVGAADGTLGTDDVPYRAVSATAGGAEIGAIPSAGAGAAGAGATAAPAENKAEVVLTQLVQAVVAAGIVEVDGDIVGDDSAFVWEPYPEDWAQDDLLWGYGAPVSALTVGDNQVPVSISPGVAAGEPVTVTVGNEAGWLPLDASAVRTGAPGTGAHVGLSRSPDGGQELRAWGTLAAGAPALREEIAVREPALFAVEMLRTMLARSGVRVTGKARALHRMPLATDSFREQVRQASAAAGGGLLATGEKEAVVCAAEGNVCKGSSAEAVGERPAEALARGAQVLAKLPSPTVAEDVMATNKNSLNLHAELLLERLGLALGNNAARVGEDGRMLADAGSRAQGVSVVRSVLAEAGLDPDDVVLVDGSGLSTHDLVTPAAMTHMLVWSSGQPWFPQWKATLPVGGVDGTLAGRFTKRPLRGRVQAKTGTLGESRALAGYLQCASGRTVAFTVMVDGHAPGGTADREAMDRMVEAIYRAE